MKIALLDTNVLLALAWPNHQFHQEAHAWFKAEARYGWATCALTQLAFVRLSANPAFTSSPVSAAEAAALLQRLLDRKEHHAWPSPRADRPEIYGAVLGHKQVNDAYFVELCRQKRGRLVTFDRRLLAHAGAGELVHLLTS